MKRRAFIGALASGTLATPRVVRARTARKVSRVGILSTGVASRMTGSEPLSPSVSALLRGLRALGRVYGRDFVTEPRGTEGRSERLPALAAELVRLQLDVIVAVGLTLGVVKQATSTIPVVMIGSDDPVGRGHVQSLRHPGGNITGLSTQGTETAPKRIELLKELVPGAAPVAVLWDQASRPLWQATEAAARQRGWTLLSLEIRDANEIEGAFRAATKANAGGMVVAANRFTIPNAQRVVELAAESRLAAIYEFPFFIDAGGLMSYGVNEGEMWYRAAAFVDKVLRGVKPADLPVEQVNTFELLINLKTSKDLGLRIPPALRLRADRIVE